MARKIEVQIVGDADSLHKALKSATGQANRFGGVLKGALKVGAAGAAAAFGGLAIASKIGFDEFSQGAQVAAQTRAVLKSTGGAANVTAKQVDRLGAALMAKSGVDDEVIKSSENMLLTFTNVRNEVGKGNDIFTQATKTVTDMSVALGQDSKNSAIQLGKALNDPVKGITALQRVGVSFTESQKTQIQALVDSGNTMKAQKIILGELNKEFGGSAEAIGKTVPGQLNILKETFKNTAGEIVSGFMPVLVKIAKSVLPAVASVMKVVGRFATQFAQGLAGSGPSSVAQAGWKVHQVFVGVVIPAFKAVWRFIQTNIVPIVIRLKNVFMDSVSAIARTLQEHGPQLHRIFARVGTVIQNVGKVAMPILRFALVKVLPVAIGIAIDTIDQLTGYVGTISDKLRSWADRTRGVAHRVGGYLGHIADKFKPITDAVRWLLDHLNIHFNITATGSGSSLLSRLGSGAASGITGGLSNFRAAGGPVVAGRSYVVGEKGPEILQLGARGGYVHSNRDSQAMVSRGDNPGGDTTVQVFLDGQLIEAAAVRVYKQQSKGTAQRLTARRAW